MARNNQPVIKCSLCDNPAEYICPQCKHIAGGWNCSDCLDKYEKSECLMNEFNKYNSYVEGNYAITKIKPGKLWVKDYIINSGHVYPV